jgi:hypothetical protein
MQFDPNSRIVKLCAEGMMLEGCEWSIAKIQQRWTERSTVLFRPNLVYA